MKAHLTQKGFTLQKTESNAQNSTTQYLLHLRMSQHSLNDSHFQGKQSNLRKTLELLQNQFNCHRSNLTSKQAGLLFTEGSLQQTDFSLPINMRFSSIKNEAVKIKQSFAMSRMAYQSTTTDCCDTYENITNNY
jgi:hypothetical protein